MVAEVVARLLAGASLRSITRDFNSRGLRTTRGGLWTETQVRQIALRPSNAGLRTHKGAVVAEGSVACAGVPRRPRAGDPAALRPGAEDDPGGTEASAVRGAAVREVRGCDAACEPGGSNGRAIYRCENLDMSARRGRWRRSCWNWCSAG